MKYLQLGRLVVAAALVVLASPFARADVLGTGRGTWGAWVSPTTGSGAFWDNVSRDGRSCDAMVWVNGTGNCASPISGFYRDASGAGLGDDWYGISLRMPKTGLGPEIMAGDGLGSTRKPANAQRDDAGYGLTEVWSSSIDDVLPVPEPATLLLLASGLLAAARTVHRARKK